MSVTLAASEYIRLQESAKEYGHSVTSHLKRRALAHLESKHLLTPELAKRLDDLSAILRNIGNNLNQMARHSNEMRYFLDTEQVQSQLQRMEAVIHRFATHHPTARE